MASSPNEPFIIVKNYRQQQQQVSNTKKDMIKEKTIQKNKDNNKDSNKDNNKKGIKIKKVSSSNPMKHQIDQILLAQVIRKHQQQQLLFQQFLQNQQSQIVNQVDDNLVDEYSPIYYGGIPTTPQNLALQRRLSREDDDFKI